MQNKTRIYLIDTLEIELKNVLKQKVKKFNKLTDNLKDIKKNKRG